MCFFGCRNRQRRSCCEQWNTTNSTRSDSVNYNGCGETQTRRTWDSRNDSARYSNCDNCDCDCDCDD